MKSISLVSALLALALAGCSTNYMAYYGSTVQHGTGGACFTVDGIDIWQEGTPPRKFQVIGVIADERPDGPLDRLWSMPGRNGQIASLAKKHGGDAVIVAADERQFAGTLSSANSFGTVNATAYGTPYGASAYGTINTFSTGSTVANYNRLAKFYVIKYL